MEAAPTQPMRALRAPHPAGEAARREAARDGRLAQIALVVVVGFAIFDDGASGPSALAWTIGLCALLGLLLVARCLRPQAAVPRAAPGTVVAIGLLTAFAAWSGITVLWSVDAAGTWEELNRAILYVLVIAIAAAATSLAGEGGVRRAGHALLALTTVVALYALGGKVIPGFTLLGLIDLDHTSDLARLRGPLGYWNALALVLATGIPFALRMAADVARSQRERIGGFAIAFILFTPLCMTYSRGGYLALGAALAVLTALGPARLRTLVVGVAVVACALPGVLYAFEQPRLVANGVDLSARIDAGRTLGLVLIACFAALLLVAWGLLRLEPRVSWSPARSRTVFRSLGAATAIVAIIGAIVVSIDAGGPRAALDDATSAFTERQQDDQFDPARVLTTNSGNRWIWWNEAAGAFSDRPFGGWGAGSFSVVHKLYRTDQLAVAQPHSVPLQFLAETGIVGGLLALGAIATLLGIAFLRVRSMPLAERSFGAPLLAAGVAWFVHGIFDWDWSLPGATLPAMVALGAVAALPARGRPPREQTIAAVGGGVAEPTRWGLAAAATIIAVLATASAVLPARADRVATDAERIAGDAAGDEDALRRAAGRAELAARLDPLDPRPLFVAASIAQGRGRLLEARGHLLEAVDRQPYSAEAWLRLSQVALALADFPGFAQAARRVLENDPAAGTSRGLVRRVEVALTPPGSSATATATPLPAVPDTAAPAPGSPMTPAPDADAGAPGPGAVPDPAPPPQPGLAVPLPGATETLPGTPAPGTGETPPPIVDAPGSIGAP